MADLSWESHLYLRMGKDVIPWRFAESAGFIENTAISALSHRRRMLLTTASMIASSPRFPQPMWCRSAIRLGFRGIRLPPACSNMPLAEKVLLSL
jgi:hypothetical protein